MMSSFSRKKQKDYQTLKKWHETIWNANNQKIWFFSVRFFNKKNSKIVKELIFLLVKGFENDPNN